MEDAVTPEFLGIIEPTLLRTTVTAWGWFYYISTAAQFPGTFVQREFCVKDKFDKLVEQNQRLENALTISLQGIVSHTKWIFRRSSKEMKRSESKKNQIKEQLSELQSRSDPGFLETNTGTRPARVLHSWILRILERGRRILPCKFTVIHHIVTFRWRFEYKIIPK